MEPTTTIIYQPIDAMSIIVIIILVPVFIYGIYGMCFVVIKMCMFPPPSTGYEDPQASMKWLNSQQDALNSAKMYERAMSSALEKNERNIQMGFYERRK